MLSLRRDVKRPTCGSGARRSHGPNGGVADLGGGLPRAARSLVVKACLLELSPTICEAIPFIKVSHGLLQQQLGGYKVALLAGVPHHGKKKRSPIVIGLTIHLIHLQQLFGTRPVAQGYKASRTRQFLSRCPLIRPELGPNQGILPDLADTLARLSVGQIG